MDIIYILTTAFKMGLPYALLALGIFLTYRILDFADLTAEGSFTLGAVVAITGIIKGVNPFLSTFLSLISGFLAGMITGLLYTKCKIPKLLSGIITMTGLYSISMVIMGIGVGRAYTNVVYSTGHKTVFDFISIFTKNNYNIILVSFIFVLLFIILMYWFFGTEIGMAIRATGMNTKMARAQGINTTFMTILCLSISNALIATGGALYAQSQGSANANTGVGALVIGLSAIIIGEGIFGKRSFKNWLISVALGAVVYFMIITIAIELGMPTQYTRLMYAVIITVVLVMPLIKKLISKKVMKHARN